MFSELAPSGVLVFDSNDAGDGQDLADGRALRLLREALPPRHWYRLTSPNAGQPGFFVQVGNIDWPDLHEADGATIAEAADKCRDALG